MGKNFKFKCSNCNCVNLTLKVQTISTGEKRIKAQCHQCGKYWKWVGATELTACFEATNVKEILEDTTETKKVPVKASKNIFNKLFGEKIEETFINTKRVNWNRLKEITEIKTTLGEYDFVIYTDGACTHNGWTNNVGGYAYQVFDVKESVHLPVTKNSNRAENTTNNKMELTAILESLKAVEKLPNFKETSSILIRTDSKYSISCITEYIKIWHNNGWKTLNGEPVKNRELIEEIYNLYKKYCVTFQHVKGHQGCAQNNYCDVMAKRAIQGK